MGTRGGQVDEIAADPRLRGLRTALLDSSFDLAAIFDPDGRLVYLNPAGRRLLGLGDAGSEIAVSAILTPEDRTRFEGDIVPELRSVGTWGGQIMLQRSTGVEIPTRSTIEWHDGGFLTWTARDLTETKAVMQRIAQRTFFDDVTGLPHRSIFLDKLDLALRRFQDGNTPVAVLFINLDRFKDKNDRFGLEIGNVLLKEVAGRLTSILTDERDTLARWGGDEFVILREGIEGNVEKAAIAMADEVASTFSDVFYAGDDEVFMTASVGITTAAPGELGTDEMMRHADAACQYAKQRGGACHHFFDEEMRTRAWRRAEVETSLNGAADRGELVLYFQPEVLLRSNRIVATEALVRWQHPAWGLVSPAEFIPVAEASNLILDVSSFVLDEGMRQCAEWQVRYPERRLAVAINLSGRQFREEDFIDVVSRSLHDSGVDPGLIVLEITESVLMDDFEETTKTLRQLKDLGVRLAVDDFGTGYSSLSYLRQFPIDILKVDQSFVSGLGHDPEDSAIVQAVVSMGQALGLMTIAEGVETAHQLIELRELQCDVAQGYHFARPAPADGVEYLLDAGDDWLNRNA